MFGVKRLKGDEEKAEAKELVSNFDENDGIESAGFFLVRRWDARTLHSHHCNNKCAALHQ